MAYIGPPPSQKLATPTSQYFSGNGSATAFTLNRPVNVAEDLNVFVNNVAQQPGAGKSYTATGTTLTFDAAPDAGTNNVYVVYRGLSEGTLRIEGTTTGIDDNATSTAMTLDSSGNVGIGTISPIQKLHIEGNTQVNGYVFQNNGTNAIGLWGEGNADMRFGTNNAERMKIDSSGRVTMPYQPAFSAIGGTNSNGTAYTIPFTTAVANVGGCYNTSTYRFTSPVAGTFFFMHNGMSGGGYNRTAYKVNGAFVGGEFFSQNAAYANFVGSIVLTLAVNDYVEVLNDLQANSQGDMHNDYRAFSGFLIG